MPVLTALAPAAIQLALPFILGQLAKKSAPGLANVIDRKLGKKIQGPLLQGQSRPVMPTLAGKAVRGVGGMGGALTGVGLLALPYIMNLLGGTVKAGGVAAGAGLGALGPAMQAIAAVPQSKIEAYGHTPATRMAAAMTPLGAAAGTGVAALGGALGNTMAGIGDSMRIAKLGDTVRDRVFRSADQIKKLGLTQHEANLLGHMGQGPTAGQMWGRGL